MSQLSSGCSRTVGLDNEAKPNATRRGVALGAMRRDAYRIVTGKPFAAPASCRNSVC